MSFVEEYAKTRNELKKKASLFQKMIFGLLQRLILILIMLMI